MHPLRVTINANRNRGINDGQIGCQRLLDDVAIIDLRSGLFFIGFGGWARLTGVNTVNDMCVHCPQQTGDNVEGLPFPLPVVFQLPDHVTGLKIKVQMSLVSVAELRCALVVLSCVRARLKHEYLVRIALQTLAV